MFNILQMDDIPSLGSWTPSNRPWSSKRRGRVHYSPLLTLEGESLDEVPLMREEGEGEGEESGESSREMWVGRRRWRNRIRSRSSLVGLLFDGGWQLLLRKWVELPFTS